MNTNRINLINFVRDLEPRTTDPNLQRDDLFEATRQEMLLARRWRLPVTWLLQYDALMDPRYQHFFRTEIAPEDEIGIWMEVVQPLVEKAGLPWRGRYPWDWHVKVGFSIGYTQEERRKLADVFLADFKAVFGHYPKSMGSWLFDSYLLGYLQDRYGLETACNCKEQYGTDGYTLWGGYWANAYYPSKVNSLMPAQDKAHQIDVPVFRMLGSDPLYQYDAAVVGNGQSVVTLEPVYTGKTGGGGSPKWVDWFLSENFREPHLALAYAQAGQENSFCWDRIGKGLTDQCEKLARRRDAGEFLVETLAETGRWFHQQYPTTPATAVTTLEDWRGKGHQGLWYLCKSWRANLFKTTEGALVMRDWQCFDQSIPETFWDSRCPSDSCAFRTLPVVDGLIHRGRLMLAAHFQGFTSVEAKGADSILAQWENAGAPASLLLTPDGWRLTQGDDTPLDWTFDAEAARKDGLAIRVTPQALECTFQGHSYRITAEAGAFAEVAPGHLQILPDQGRISLK